MNDTRQKNKVWNVVDEDGRTVSWDAANCAVLMDVRDELQAIRRILECRNVQAMALATQRIDKRLAKKLPLK